MVEADVGKKTEVELVWVCYYEYISMAYLKSVILSNMYFWDFLCS